jgi:hypothetical protein
MQKPQEISTAARLIYITIVAAFSLDIYEVWIGKIGLIELVVSWFFYLLIALIPYGLSKGKKVHVHGIACVSPSPMYS